MKNYMALTLLLTFSSQMVASQAYTTVMNLVRQNMPKAQHAPHDLTEYKATVIFSGDDVFGDKQELLQLSDAGSKLIAALTEQEKARLPRISIATPGTFAMKFYCSNECCFRRFITTELPTEDDLNKKLPEVRFV